MSGALRLSSSHLHGDGSGGRADHRLHQALGKVGHAHQRRAGIAVDHPLGRAAEIDVDDIGARVLGDPGRGGHPAGVAAGELHHVRQPGRRHQLAAHVVVADAERAAGDHFRDDEAGAIAGGELSHRSVGDAGHGGEKRPIADRLIADAQAAGRITQ